MECLGELIAAGALTPEQMATVATRVGQGDKSLVSALAAMTPLCKVQPDAVKSAVGALLSAPAAAAASEANRVSEAAPAAAEETDTNESNANHSDPQPPQPLPTKEVVVVCLDASGSMEAPFEVEEDARIRNRTRADAVKQCFYGFRDQTESYCETERCQHLLGLLSYDDKVTVLTEPTASFAVFEDAVDLLKPRGRTAIYESITTACSMLEKYRSAYPDCDLRVMVLTDGQNNCTKVSSGAALARLNAIGAVCDCLLVGGRPDDDLLRLVAATEGCATLITCLADAYECLESQSIISLDARRDGAPRPTVRPPQKKLGAQAMVQQGVMKRQRRVQAVDRTVPLADVSQLQLPNKRMAKELASLRTDAGALCGEACIDVSGQTVALRTKLEGGDSTPYQGRKWEVSVELPTDYPFKGPKVRVVTEIYHYAVSTDGNVCLPALQAWSPARTIAVVLRELRTLLFEWDKIDPSGDLQLRSHLSEQMRVDPQKYLRDASNHARTHGLPA
eukprot:TRINITY_DN9323_c0_g1_i1.p1 TRINITY_DN9323_c0_g1~~TRINITY_DN9323_c0_g1_i1.p1  ORF type:complete len:506 (+),score=159.94 TRINITY_DN9323_c0_g1_i1:94-1611(+)